MADVVLRELETLAKLYREQQPRFLRSKKTSFLSTGSFFRKKVYKYKEKK